MGILLDYTCCTHIVQSIYSIIEIANRKTQPQFENVYRGGVGGGGRGGSPFLGGAFSKL